MYYLQYTTITDSGVSHDIEFPLHPETNSPEGVSQVTSKLLESISNFVWEDPKMSDGDILQALSMVCAIRTDMLAIDSNTAEQLLLDLFKQNYQAVLQAKPGIASRA